MTDFHVCVGYPCPVCEDIGQLWNHDYDHPLIPTFDDCPLCQATVTGFICEVGYADTLAEDASYQCLLCDSRLVELTHQPDSPVYVKWLTDAFGE